MWLLLQLSEASSHTSAVRFDLNGVSVEVEDDHGTSLLDALREQLRCRSVKDGCSPQGQCGCCTVWVDGAARVACVTALRRVAGRSVTTVEGLEPARSDRWSRAFVTAGASQCGFCTPGIVLRLAALEQGRRPVTRHAVESALLAHLCRCTGWQSIIEAACAALGLEAATDPALPSEQNLLLAAWRAEIEGRTGQSTGPEVVLGGGGFADDAAPREGVVQLGASDSAPVSSWLAARAATTKVQGRNSTAPLVHPVAIPPGEWALTLQTTWVEPAYLEPDASWSLPGHVPASPLANGGAFGGKRRSPAPARARALTEGCEGPARVLWSREDVVRYGPKRPPLALGLRPDGSGVVRIGRTPGSDDLDALRKRVHDVAPHVVIEETEIVGPPVGGDLRGAGWVEVLAALCTLGALEGPPPASGPGWGAVELTVPGEGRAAVRVETTGGPEGRGEVTVDVWAGEPLDTVTLRSYIVGAVHQALGLVRSEGIAVDGDGQPLDLTIRSFGILTAREMPQVNVVVHEEDGWPVNGSDAVFAATVAAAWIAEGTPPHWPTRRGSTPPGRVPPATDPRSLHAAPTHEEQV